MNRPLSLTYYGRLQIANGRWVTDRTTFGFLANIFILPSYQGTGVGKWFIAEVLMKAFGAEKDALSDIPEHKLLNSVKYDTNMRFLLSTGTASMSYEWYASFEVVSEGEYMASVGGN